jgi:glycerophosphoryl diester phosphodiesterase
MKQIATSHLIPAMALALLVQVTSGCSEEAQSVSSSSSQPNTQSSGTDSTPEQTKLLYANARSFSPFVSAHRGGAAYAPENTMEAFRNAARLGVDDLEADTTLSKDGMLVLIHDSTLDRTTNCKGPVNAKTYAELQECDAGFWYTPGQATTAASTQGPFPYRNKRIQIPLAQELFEFASTLGPFGPSVTIEIKNIPGEDGYEPACPTAAGNLVPIIQKSGIKDRIIVQSFDPSCLITVRAMDSNIQTLNLNFASATVAITSSAAAGFTYASPAYNLPDLNSATVNLAKQLNVKLNPYTVDTESDLQKMADLGVDGVITNYPACMLAIQKRPLPDKLLSSTSEPVIVNPEKCKPN